MNIHSEQIEFDFSIIFGSILSIMNIKATAKSLSVDSRQFVTLVCPWVVCPVRYNGKLLCFMSIRINSNVWVSVKVGDSIKLAANYESRSSVGLVNEMPEIIGDKNIFQKSKFVVWNLWKIIRSTIAVDTPSTCS